MIINRISHSSCRRDVKTVKAFHSEGVSIGAVCRRTIYTASHTPAHIGGWVDDSGAEIAVSGIGDDGCVVADAAAFRGITGVDVVGNDVYIKVV